jgi:hypothetical protein
MRDVNEIFDCELGLRDTRTGPKGFIRRHLAAAAFCSAAAAVVAAEPEAASVTA